MEIGNINLDETFRRNTSWIKENHSAEIYQINRLLAKYDLHINRVIDAPTLTTYVIDLDFDSEINKVLKLERNFAIACNDSNVRVYQSGSELRIEAKSNDNTVYFGTFLNENKYQNSNDYLMAIGIDNHNEKVFYDLNKAPHMLVAGTTGSGKSVFLHQLIASLLLKKCNEIEIIGIDPKGTEFFQYDKLNNFNFINNTKNAIGELWDLCCDMDSRYQIFAQAGCRDIDSYNKTHLPLTHKVCVIDEFADLMLTSGSQVEGYVVRLAQKARAAGIHLIIATQRPTANVITGLIKANIPTRVALKVTNGIDSRIILDRTGAEKLNGHGDMLFLRNGEYEPIRVQSSYLEDGEIHNVVMFACLLNGQVKKLCERK